MLLLQSEELGNHLKSIIHRETQLHQNHFDLTVDTIHSFTGAGSLDFGGSEFEAAETEIIESKKKVGDDYGWWHLSGGVYQATMNEIVKEFEDTIAIISPHEHALKAGINLTTTLLSSEEEGQKVKINFTVPSAGCNIKENARFAALYLLAN